jgi:hypothetical protein
MVGHAFLLCILGQDLERRLLLCESRTRHTNTLKKMLQRGVSVSLKHVLVFHALRHKKVTLCAEQLASTDCFIVKKGMAFTPVAVSALHDKTIESVTQVP